MAKTVHTVKVSKNGLKTKEVFKDTSKKSGRQQLHGQKITQKGKTERSRIISSAVRSAAMNVGQAITGVTGSVISANQQKEATKRLAIQTAADQATKGGLTASDDSRDEDSEETTENGNSYPWGVGRL